MKGKKNLPRWQIVILVIICLLIIGGGGWFYITQRQALLEDAENELRAVADLKVDQIINWRDERMGDAAVLMGNQILEDAVASCLSTGDEEKTEQILTLFRSLQESYSYYDILLIDSKLQIRQSLRGATGPLHEDTIQAIQSASETTSPTVSSLHSGPGALPPHIDIIAPFFKESEDGVELTNAIILQTDARQFLYPLIQSWPTPSKTAETLLIRREGNDVLFLNELRHEKNTALSLRFPLTQIDLPATMAVLGQEGLVRGKDYRGVEVLAVIQGVPDTPWFMVSKIDEAEALSIWRLTSSLILALLAGLVAATVAVIGLVWQISQKSHYQALFQAEAALRASEARHSVTLMSVGDGVIVTDIQGRVELMNPVAQALTGWNQKEARGLLLEDVFKIISEKTRQPVESPVNRVLRYGMVAGLASDTLLCARDGTEHPIADSGAPIKDEKGAIKGVVMVFRDQSVERASQKALLESERKFREAITYLDESYYRSTMDGILLDHNLAFCRILGFDSYIDLKGTNLLDLWQDPQERIVYLDELSRDGFVRNRLVNAKRIDGEGITVLLSAHLLKDEENLVVGIEGSFSDITERIRMEQALKKSEALLNEMGRVAVVGGWEIDAKTMELTWTEENYRIHDLPLTYEPNLDDVLSNYYSSSSRSIVERAIQRAIDDGEAFDVELGITTAMGNSRWIHAVGKVEQEDHKTVRIFGTFQDITEQKRIQEELFKYQEQLEELVKERTKELEEAQERLIRQEKLAILGQLAGGIGHELRNPLGVIKNAAYYLNMIIEEEEPRPEIQEVIQVLNKEIGNAERIITSLLDYARAKTPDRRKADVNQIVHEALSSVLTNVLSNDSSGIEVSLNLEEGLPPIMADQGQLVQVFNNIIQNGIQALPHNESMRQTGRLVIRTIIEKPDWVTVSVSDNGVGIREENIHKIFEPLFTTKAKGIGLGMAVVKTLVEGHGGVIDVMSQEGVGTTFTVMLPIGANATNVEGGLA